jgi:competence protein ComEC
MGYRAEKEKTDKRKGLAKRIALAVVVVLLVGLCVFGAFCAPITWKYYFNYPELAERKDGEMRVHFLDVGQGDSALVELPDGKTLLVDGGDLLENTSTTIMRYLNALDIDVIDYLVVSHADQDHCGGLSVVTEHKTVLNAYMPAVNPAKAGDAFATVYANLVAQGTAMFYSSRAIKIGEGAVDYKLAFLYPYAMQTTEGAIISNSSDADANELSSVLWLEYADTSVLFMGDAPFEIESFLTRDDGLGSLGEASISDVEILKVSHHGAKGSTMEWFLEYMNLETAVVSCGLNNMYGHPAAETVDRIAAAGAKLYRTDQSGTISVTVQPSGAYTISTQKF